MDEYLNRPAEPGIRLDRMSLGQKFDLDPFFNTKTQLASAIFCGLRDLGQTFDSDPFLTPKHN